MARHSVDREVDRRSFLRITGSAGVAGASSMLAGCSGGNGGTTTGADNGGETTTTTVSPDKIQTGGTLKVAIQADFDTIHPHKAPGTGEELVENMANSLIYVDRNGKLHPDLAREMPKISDDGKTYTFKLRKGVKFHPPYDREVTADDVVANWRKILDEKYGGYGRGAYTGILVGEGPNGSQLDPKQTVQKTGKYEVTFNLAKTYSPFLIKQARMASYGWFSIIPMDSLEKHGKNLGNKKIGAWATGPFMYNAKESTAGSMYVFDKNPNYFKTDSAGNQLPYADRIEWRVVPEAGVRTSQLKSGKIHINDHVPATDVKQFQNSENITIKETPSTAQMSQWLNIVTYPPTSKKKVRKAMMHAMNREAIIKTKFQGHAAIAHSVFPPFHWAYNKEACVIYNHDPQKAKKLLGEAGHKNGFDLKCEPTNQPKFVDVATIIQNQYKQAGINMNVKPVSKSASYNAISDPSKDPPKSWHSLVEDFTWAFSADDYTGANFHSDAAFNYTHYENKQLDKKMMEARQTVKRSERKKLYNEIQKTLTDDLPKLFIQYTNAIYGHQNNVRNLRVWPTGFQWLEDVWLKQD